MEKKEYRPVCLPISGLKSAPVRVTICAQRAGDAQSSKTVASARVTVFFIIMVCHGCQYSDHDAPLRRAVNDPATRRSVFKLNALGEVGQGVGIG